MYIYIYMYTLVCHNARVVYQLCSIKKTPVPSLECCCLFFVLNISMLERFWGWFLFRILSKLRDENHHRIHCHRHHDNKDNNHHHEHRHHHDDNMITITTLIIIIIIIILIW